MLPFFIFLAKNKVATGLYNYVSEVIREALRLLVSKETIPQERLDMLNRDIEEGLADLEAGRYEDETYSKGFKIVLFSLWIKK